jgi:hypothetical protein
VTLEMDVPKNHFETIKISEVVQGKYIGYREEIAFEDEGLSFREPD